ncbi:HAD family phosphatase [Corynebacterium sp. MSK006]|uniref:HAD family hydrolase n=1 Tax=Corynebacterium sp. MSK006 TaxID=3050187 RepID=UPI00254BB6D1|nr:HAD family phosphatase [Corynebacterium sp. MSK006]MDK8895736.1 HAD family phosphatase [Corynebacterium sp. MSK006]
MAASSGRTPAAVFFDMDGTMVDSEPLWGIATFELSEKLGRRLTPELRQATIGGSFPNTLRICAEHAGVTVDEATADRLREEMFARVADLFRERLEPKPGVRDLLGDLGSAGVPAVVTTNTVRPLADIAIDAVGRDFFADAVTGDQVARYKPAPDMFLEAARRTGVSPADCVVFEDSLAGMSGALEAGCVVIGLPEVPGQAPQPGAADLGELNGERSFVGVDAHRVGVWFDRLSGV